MPVDIDPNQLPNDPAALRQMVVGLLEQAAEQERRLKQLQHWLEQLLRAAPGTGERESAFSVCGGSGQCRSGDSTRLGAADGKTRGGNPPGQAEGAWSAAAAPILGAAAGGP